MGVWKLRPRSQRSKMLQLFAKITSILIEMAGAFRAGNFVISCKNDNFRPILVEINAYKNVALKLAAQNMIKLVA